MVLCIAHDRVAQMIAPHADARRTFECISVVLCLQPMLASPALAFVSATAVEPPAAPLLVAVLREEFLPIASKHIMKSRWLKRTCLPLLNR